MLPQVPEVRISRCHVIGQNQKKGNHSQGHHVRAAPGERTMDLGTKVQENLCLAGNAAHIPDKCFEQLIKRACRGVLSDADRNAVAGA